MTTEQSYKGKNWGGFRFLWRVIGGTFQTRILREFRRWRRLRRRRLTDAAFGRSSSAPAPIAAPKPVRAQLEPGSRRDRRAAGLEPLGQRAVGEVDAHFSAALLICRSRMRGGRFAAVPLHRGRRAQDDAVVRVAPQRDDNSRRERLAEGRLARGRGDDHLELIRAAPQDLAPLDRRAADGVR